MNKPDARFLNPTTQNYLRQQAIRLREQGKQFVDIAHYLGVHRNTVSDWWQQYQEFGEIALKQQERGRNVGEGRTLSQEQEHHYLGVHRNTVSDWWQQYQEFGEIALKQQERGRNVGEGRTLSQEQEHRIQQLMQEHFPEDLEIDSALWTRRAVQQLIEQVCEVQMPICTVGEYLKRWGCRNSFRLTKCRVRPQSLVPEFSQLIRLSISAFENWTELISLGEMGSGSGCRNSVSPPDWHKWQ
jgi:transposase